MTTAQRQRKGPPTKLVNFRATEQTRSEISELVMHLSTVGRKVTATEVIARAIHALAAAELGGKR